MSQPRGGGKKTSLNSIGKAEKGVKTSMVRDTDLFKMVYGQPYLTLGIKHTAQIAPSHCKVWLGLNGFQVTSLQGGFNGIAQKRRRRGRVGKV